MKLLQSFKDLIEKRLGRSPVALPYSPGMSKVLILPTKFGIFFILLLQALFMGGINSGNNPSIIFTSLLISIFISSLIFNYYRLYGMKVLEVEFEPYFADSQTKINIYTSINSKIITPVFFARYEDETTFFDSSEDGSSKVTLFAPNESLKRGIHPAGKIKIGTLRPFFFSECWFNFRPAREIVIYPKLLNSNELAEINMVINENINGRMIGDEIKHIREYRTGDSPRSIHWPSTLKTGRIMLKEFESVGLESQNFNLSNLEHLPLETALSLIATNIYSANQNSTPFSLSLPNNEIPIGTGEEHMHKCLRALSEI